MPSSRLLKKSQEIKKGSQYQSRKDANPIGPQKTKSQVQANQKIELPLYDDDGPSEMEITEQNEMDPQNAQPEICEETSTISSDTQTDAKKNSDDSKKKSVAEIMKERISKAWKIQLKDMPLNDKLEYRDPQVVAEYSQDIYESMRKEED